MSVHYQTRKEQIIRRLTELKLQRERYECDHVPAWFEPSHHAAVPSRLAKLCSRAWGLIQRSLPKPRTGNSGRDGW